MWPFLFDAIVRKYFVSFIERTSTTDSCLKKKILSNYREGLFFEITKIFKEVFFNTLSVLKFSYDIF
ncbi:hypothetical protein AB834_03195 [PVC group bacterium (ex Bugula neritina AB1)]|nr:hypothetical protein AB834_03195 [PVC group bacterium (ex Bugula neritina AB1)]